jgi:hypothetical protein
MSTVDEVIDEVVRAEEGGGADEPITAEEEFPSETEADPEPRGHLEDPEDSGAVPDEGPTRAQLVRISEIGGVQLWYERWSRPPAPITFSVAPAFKPVLERTVREVQERAPQTWGKLVKITSGGAFVSKPGAHGTGKAIDWDRFTFANVEIAPKGRDHLSTSLARRRRYWALAAICRANSSYVLHGAHDDGPHDDHLHHDTTGDPAFVRKHSTITLVQSLCNEIFDQQPKLVVDGDLGERTQTAIAAAMRRLTLNGDFGDPVVWRRFLRLTGRLGFALAKDV